MRCFDTSIIKEEILESIEDNLDGSKLAIDVVYDGYMDDYKVIEIIDAYEEDYKVIGAIEIKELMLGNDISEEDYELLSEEDKDWLLNSNIDYFLEEIAENIYGIQAEDMELINEDLDEDDYIYGGDN